MRVPRESVAIAPAVEPMSAAFGQDLPLRVPANYQSNASVESTSSHGSECGEPIPPPPPESTPAPVKKRVFVSEFAKSPKLSVDLSTLQQYIKSHDWAIRNQVFGTLNKVISAKDFKMSPKIIELVSAGLKDPHFRVAQSALSTTETLLDIGVGPESLLTSAVVVVYQSTQKTRQPWSELYASTLERLTVMVGDAAPSLLLHVLGDPSLAKKGRARTGLIHCLSLVPQSSLSAFVIKQASEFLLYMLFYYTF